MVISIEPGLEETLERSLSHMIMEGDYLCAIQWVRLIGVYECVFYGADWV